MPANTHHIIYLTDTHLKENKPVGRADDYLEAILAKIQEVSEYTRSLKENGKYVTVVHGGDLFDGPRIGIYGLVQTYLAICRSATTWDIVVGNHDWRGSWDEWKSRSPLTALEMFKACRVHPDGYRKDFGCNVVHSIHKCLVEKPVPWEHILFKEYDGPGTVILTSDYHPTQGHKVLSMRGAHRHFISPGAIARTSRSESDIKRKPQFVHIVLTEDSVKSVKFIPISCAKPAREIFTEEVVEEDKSKQTFDQAIELLKMVSQNFGTLSLTDVLKIVTKTTKAPEEVNARCLSRLSR